MPVNVQISYELHGPGWTTPVRLTKLVVMAGVRVRLTFPEHLITEPVVGRMMQRFDVLPNIRRANIEDSVGWMVCEISGERPTVEAALAWLAGEGVQVDRLGDVVEG